MSGLGHEPKCRPRSITSALPPKADIPSRLGNVGLGPGAAIRRTRAGRLRRRSAYALPSTKSGLFQPLEHLIPRLLRAELSGKRPGVKEWP